MEKPVIADKKPALVELEPGKNYAWCACGRSKGQPFCDGSHKGTGITPIAFKVDAPRKAALCNCKHSANKPYCDGTHSKL